MGTPGTITALVARKSVAFYDSDPGGPRVITDICCPNEECLFCSVKCTTGKFASFLLADIEFGT